MGEFYQASGDLLESLCLVAMVVLRSSKILPHILFNYYSMVSMQDLGPVVVIQGEYLSLSMVLSVMNRKVLFFIGS